MSPRLARLLLVAATVATLPLSAAAPHVLGEMWGTYLANLLDVVGFLPLVGALGTGAIYERNLPPPGTFSIDPVAFAIRTSRNRKPNPVVPWPGFATTAGQRIDAVGIVASVMILFDGTATVGATGPTATNQWPWNLIKSLIVSANGSNNLFACDGADLRALMRVRNAARGSSGGSFLFDR